MEKYFQPKPGTKPVLLAFAIFEGIEVDMEIGVHPTEIGRMQRITIDVNVGFPDSKTRIADSKEGLLEGFDYSMIHQCVMESVKERTALLETLANRIAKNVLERGALTCEIAVKKTRTWPNVSKVGIRIYREAM